MSTPKLRTLIVDDETPARQRLTRLLASRTSIEVIGEATNGLEALAEVDRLNPDLVFLDIEMPELDGLGVASALGATTSAPAIVFVTAFDEHALKAFELAAVDYLVKPVVEARLDSAIERVLSRTSRERSGAPDLTELLKTLAPKRPARLALRIGTKYAVFDPAEISAIVAAGDYAAVRVGGRELLSDDTLDGLSKRLDSSVFQRIHRSSIINMRYLSELEHQGDRKYLAVLSDPVKSRLPVSRERLSELKARLGLASD